MLVPHGAGSSRAVAVSRVVLQGLLGIGGLMVLGMVVLAVAAIARGVSITRYERLQHEHRLLVDEIARVQGELAIVGDSVNSMGERGQGLRLLAGLDLLDSGVQQAGIGGPPGAWPERDGLLAIGADGAQAFSARVEVDGLLRRADLLMHSVGQAYESLASHERRFAATPSIMPTHGRISSPFAAERLDPVLGIVRPHEGMDVAAPKGSEIEAPAAGVVKAVKWEDGYGNYLLIDHGYGVVTRFAHCLKILVVPGQRVKRGQTIALVGSTGESTGPHVHYEVLVNGRPVNPKKFVLPEDKITD